tara:strand:- start:1452 stop:1787 length:336 start_codon:yes stop_codon:yes gene_type:complete
MAITGKLNFKGIELPNAYININKIQWSQKRDVVLSKDKDGNITQEPIKIVVTEYECNVYSDENTRKNAPNQILVNVSGRLELSENKKDGHLLEQVYNHLLSQENFEDYKKC